VNTRDLFADEPVQAEGPPVDKADDLTWPQVRAYLEAHPEHFAADRELQETLGLKPSGPNVVDFGRAALAKLETLVERESGARKQIEFVARANFAAQAQTHAAVVSVLESRNHADLARRLDDAAIHRFGLASGVIALEGPGPVPLGWRKLPEGGVEDLLGPDGLSRLGPDEADVELFGAAADQVKSSAVVRLVLWDPPRHAVVAFGSAVEEGFTPDMGAELVAFVARVVERTAERWPVM
jgi:uncharacterized protein YigA (DUF484 family)